MADTPDFNTLPVDTANAGKKVSGVMRLVNAVNVFIQNVRIANEATDPVIVGGALLTSLEAKAPALVGGAVPVITASQVTTQTDRSSTITVGGTAQVLMAANAARKGWWLQNNSTGDLWVNDVSTASAGGGSIRVPGNGGLYESPSRVSPAAISIFGATTGQAFAAREN